MLSCAAGAPRFVILYPTNRARNDVCRAHVATSSDIFLNRSFLSSRSLSSVAGDTEATRGGARSSPAKPRFLAADRQIGRTASHG
jgi:hypothetical protein